MLPRTLLGLALTGLAAGCGGQGGAALPDIHPARGKLPRRGQPAPGGTLSFAPQTDLPHMMIQAEVGPDGSVEVVTTDTRKGGKKHPGAPAATYRVTHLVGGADQTVPPTEVPQPVVVQPGSNDLTIA